MRSERIGFALTGSFCTFEPVLAAMKRLSLEYETVVPILSFTAASTDSRFGSARSFRERIEAAFSSRDYAGSGERRCRMGKNDSIFARLDVVFGFDAALQHSISVKGSSVTRNQVQQMLKNWKKQRLIVQSEAGRYRKVQHDVS